MQRTYTTTTFNRRKLTTKQAETIARAAFDRANRKMFPKGGTLNLAYDAMTDSWIGQYVVLCSTHGMHQVGISSQGRTAIDAVRALEEFNLPHCDVVQAEFDKQSNN